MTDDSPLDLGLKLDVLAAEFRLELRDGSLAAERLAERLWTLFPGLVTVEYGDAVFTSPQHFQACSVDLGNQRYTFEVTGDQIAFQVSHRVHGIDLSHARLRQAEWLEQLFRAIADQTTLLRTESDFGRLL